MTKETPVKTEAVNLCRRFPTLPARTLARMLNRDHPRYMPLNKWNIGFAKVETDNEGRFEVSNYRIVDGRIYA